MTGGAPRVKKTLASVVLCALLSIGSAAGSRQLVPVPPARPNVILILLDDADVEITESMPRLRAQFHQKGTAFNSAIANTPLCGPSRAILLSGQYAHRNGVRTNVGRDGGYARWLAAGRDAKNLGPRLQAAGYRTGLFGKYMNDFPAGKPETFVPPGWNDFQGVLSDREAHNDRYTLNDNGTLRIHEAASGGYQTDLLSERLERFVRESEKSDDQPFFALLALSAPHVPPEPAARHQEDLPGATAPRKPSYDEADISDKPRALREQAERLTPWWGREIDSTYRQMKLSLLSVEDAVESLVRVLAETGETANTFLILASDNGWMRGEHRIPSEKYVPYEESIRVPLVVVGPGVPAGRSIERLAGMIDLYPTLLDLAGVSAASFAPESDGRSLVPLLRAADPSTVPWRDAILIEHFGGGAPYRVRSYSGIRTENETYVEYATGEVEYYDLRTDPFQMQNTATALSPARRKELARRVQAFVQCEGSSCRRADTVSAPQEGGVRQRSP